MSISQIVSSTTDRRVLLSIGEAAQLLGIGRSTLYRLLTDGDLTGVKIGARTLIRRSDLEALLESLPRK
jgi:excisionase family DNA binding protein